MLAFACAVLLAALPLSPTARLRIDLAFEGPAMPPRAEASAMHEVTSIWSAYGVDVRAIGGHATARDGAIRLTVALAADRERGLIYTLGSIQFAHGLPEPAITMYPDAIAQLVSSDILLGRDAAERSPLYREIVLGRVFGRALAHEIGHYLLRTRGHSATGLMRARLSASVLISIDLHGLDLSADEQARVRTLLRY
jgi:hypothetical protein